MASEAGVPTPRATPVIECVRGSQVQISVERPSDLGLDEIAAWHSMQRMTGSLANPFLCPEFSVGVGHFRPGARVAILTDGPTIVGFFPFERRRLGVGVPIGFGLNNRQGIIHAPAMEWNSQEILRACKISVWHFDNLVEGQQPFERYAVAVAPSAVIDLTEGFAAYQEKLRVKSPQFCKNIGRNTGKLERDAGELHYVVDSHDVAGLRTLMGWKSDQCRRKGWSNAFDRTWIVDVVDYFFSTHTDWFSGLLSLLYAGKLKSPASSAYAPGTSSPDGSLHMTPASASTLPACFNSCRRPRNSLPQACTCSTWGPPRALSRRG